MGGDVTTGRIEVLVTRRLVEAEDIDSFELTRPDGGELPPFGAGAHIDVVAPNGMLRQYSLCNHPGERRRYEIGVLRDASSRGASRAIHDQLRVGDLVQIGAPRNHFPLVRGARSLLLAAGIGVTPLMCMAEELSAAGEQFELHYCARTRRRAAFLARLAAAPYASRVHLHFDDQAQEQRLDLTALMAQAEPGTHVYVCGPAGFIELVKTTAAAHGWPPARIHVEHFGALARNDATAGSFAVRIASSGKLLLVPPDVSVADALASDGVAIPVSCKEGVCGTCITGVLEGIPDHRDCYFSDAEKARNDQFMPCCSRSLSDVLVLNL